MTAMRQARILCDSIFLRGTYHGVDAFGTLCRASAAEAILTQSCCLNRGTFGRNWPSCEGSFPSQKISQCTVTLVLRRICSLAWFRLFRAERRTLKMGLVCKQGDVPVPKLAAAMPSIRAFHPRQRLGVAPCSRTGGRSSRRESEAFVLL
jgi:hypothetical protein